MSITILRGNALALPLADASVDLVVTSPPYFGLRSYQDGGEHYEGQIGSEATPAEFIDALIAATREMVRVLKPSGSIWVNLGDKYSGYSGKNWGHGRDITGDRGESRVPIAGPTSAPDVYGIPNKSLMGIPWRYAIRCIDELGLILRAEVIWSKPNGLPESVTDRVRRSHEQWFHFTKEPRYYSAVDEVREEHAASSLARFKQPFNAAHDAGSGPRWTTENVEPNPLGKLPGSVWTIPTEPLRVPDHLGIDHFAAFPMEWPRRIITGWSPREVCTACGEGRRPVAAHHGDTPRERLKKLGGTERHEMAGGQGLDFAGSHNVWRTHSITGYACACPDTAAPATPGVVLDPFGGTGTTALVADVLGRHGITVDLSADYCRLAQWRTTDPKQRARAARVEPVDAPSPDQPDLFEEPA